MYVVQYEGYSEDPTGRDSGYAETKYRVVTTLLDAARHKDERGFKLYECKEIPAKWATDAENKVEKEARDKAAKAAEKAERE